MNILPKKRWHVRTRENIARVRRDEAKAAEEEKQKQLRVEKAEKEARLEVLRRKARDRYKDESLKQDPSSKKHQESEHINLFYELEQDVVIDKSNPEYEKEKKVEKEKYEKQIGYLTYLGQDTNEITGNVSWYNRNPEERKNIVEEVAKDAKSQEDPLRDIRKYLGTESNLQVKPKKEKEKTPERQIPEKYNGYNSLLESSRERKKKSKKLKKSKKKKKSKKRRYSSSSSSSESSDSDEIEKKKSKVDLERLRAERLKREREEGRRAESFLKMVRGEAIKEEKVDVEVEQKYNSQFNPHLAKQNVSKK